VAAAGQAASATIAAGGTATQAAAAGAAAAKASASGGSRSQVARAAYNAANSTGAGGSSGMSTYYAPYGSTQAAVQQVTAPRYASWDPSQIRSNTGDKELDAIVNAWVDMFYNQYKGLMGAVPPLTHEAVDSVISQYENIYGHSVTAAKQRAEDIFNKNTSWLNEQTDVYRTKNAQELARGQEDVNTQTSYLQGQQLNQTGVLGRNLAQATRDTDTSYAQMGRGMSGARVVAQNKLNSDYQASLGQLNADYANKYDALATNQRRLSEDVTNSNRLLDTQQAQQQYQQQQGKQATLRNLDAFRAQQLTSMLNQFNTPLQFASSLAATPTGQIGIPAVTTSTPTVNYTAPTVKIATQTAATQPTVQAQTAVGNTAGRTLSNLSAWNLGNYSTLNLGTGNIIGDIDKNRLNFDTSSLNPTKLRTLY
jgi:hypothetical protein